ncbi:hypothetical protein ES705_08172 [subsurface metagenome]
MAVNLKEFPGVEEKNRASRKYKYKKLKAPVCKRKSKLILNLRYF